MMNKKKKKKKKKVYSSNLFGNMTSSINKHGATVSLLPSIYVMHFFFFTPINIQPSFREDRAKRWSWEVSIWIMIDTFRRWSRQSWRWWWLMIMMMMITIIIAHTHTHIHTHTHTHTHHTHSHRSPSYWLLLLLALLLPVARCTVHIRAMCVCDIPRCVIHTHGQESVSFFPDREKREEDPIVVDHHWCCEWQTREWFVVALFSNDRSSDALKRGLRSAVLIIMAIVRSK